MLSSGNLKQISADSFFGNRCRRKLLRITCQTVVQTSELRCSPMHSTLVHRNWHGSRLVTHICRSTRQTRSKDHIHTASRLLKDDQSCFEGPMYHPLHAGESSFKVSRWVNSALSLSCKTDIPSLCMQKRSSIRGHVPTSFSPLRSPARTVCYRLISIRQATAWGQTSCKLSDRINLTPQSFGPVFDSLR